MKTKEELNEMKDKAKKEEKPEGKGGVMLTDEELAQVPGGAYINNGEGNPTYIPGNTYIYDNYENGGIAPEDKYGGR